MFSIVIKQTLLWGSWALFPILLDLLKSVYMVIVHFVLRRRAKRPRLAYYPTVTIIVPVYNSAATLQKCLQSIYDQEYPLENIEVFLINNGPKDDAYKIFQDFQTSHPKLAMWWLDSRKGKALALNKGIFLAKGRYIINIDSDGWLEYDAVYNVVRRFELDASISCMTGVILTDPAAIEGTKSRLLKIVQTCEFQEYAEAFLVGRNVQSMTNSMYTMAGAFSCFRYETLCRTQLYNTMTLGEDTHMTYQVRKFVGGKIVLCDDAFFYTEPIESFDRLYMQRQRWQRSEVEVARLFTDYHTGTVFDVLRKFSLRQMLLDHSLVFMNLIWMFSFLYFAIAGFPAEYYIVGTLLLTAFYALNSLVYSRLALRFLRQRSKAAKFLRKKWYVCFVMGLYRWALYFVKLAGIINGDRTRIEWNVKPLSRELQELASVFSVKQRPQD